MNLCLWLKEESGELHDSGIKEHNALVKRAIFINNSVEIREAFSFASPVEILSAINTYSASFYGCMLWNFCGEGATQVFNAWSTCVKLTWEVPRATRTYLVQQVLGAGPTSAKTVILARFAGFFASLRKSPSHEVAVLAGLTARDLRSTTGKNIKLVHELSGLVPWEYGSARIKMSLPRQKRLNILQ